MEHQLLIASFLHQELTKKLNVSLQTRSENSRSDYCSSLFLTLDVKPMIRLQMAQKRDCLAPARFRLLLALPSLHWLLVSSCQLKVLALIFKAINGLSLCYSEDCMYEEQRKTAPWTMQSETEGTKPSHNASLVKGGKSGTKLSQEVG